MLEKKHGLIKYDTQMEVLGPELQLHPSPWFVSCGTDSLDVCINITMIWSAKPQRAAGGSTEGQSQCYVCVWHRSKKNQFQMIESENSKGDKWRELLRTVCMTMTRGYHLSGDHY
jgi:hypothetical protein